MIINKYFKMIEKKEDSEKIPLYKRKMIFVTDRESMLKESLLNINTMLALLFKVFKNLISPNNSVAYDLLLAKEIFEFPPNHPQIDNFYLMNSLYPNKYIPAKDFNRYNNELKQDSFIDLCEDLGARDIFIESIIEEGKEYKVGANMPIPIDENNTINASIKTDIKIIDRIGLKAEIHFNENNKEIKKNIRPCPWLNTETSWKKMCKRRQDNKLKSGETYSVHSTYDEYKLLEIESGLEKIFKIFGKSSENYKIQVKYKVIFW